MAIVFNVDEVLEMAEQIERNGAKFYRKTAQINSGLHDMLMKIAGEEDKHLATFSVMRDRLKDRDTEPTVFDPDGQASLFLKAMADSRVFNVGQDTAMTLTGRETVEQIVNIAIGKEKDSIVFYTGLKEMVPASLGRSKMDVIIKEEMSHISWLTGTLKGK